MPDEPKSEGCSYQIGEVGAGARIAQGENISGIEGVSRLPDGEALKQQFDALLEPGVHAKSWFSGAASWVGDALGDILKSEAAQKTLGTVTEAATKSAIASFMG
jgi:hypothetical protein